MSGVGHGHGGEHGGENKRIALLISVLALVLAFSETLGKSAQTIALSQNVEASNLWSFFQAKTIRMTVLRTAAEEAEVTAQQIGAAKAREAVEQRVATWRKTAERYDSEPETGEGRKELAARRLSRGRRAHRPLPGSSTGSSTIKSAGWRMSPAMAPAASPAPM